MHVLDRVDRERITALLSRDEFFWLDLTSPSPDDLDSLSRLANLDGRTARELGERTPLPRLDDFSAGQVLLVYFGVGDAEQGFAPIPVRILITGGFIVTVHEEACKMLDEVADRFGGRPEVDEGEVIYKVLGALTDSFFGALDAHDDAIQSLEDSVLERPRRTHLRAMVDVKGQLVHLRKIVTRQRNILARAEQDLPSLPGLQASPRAFRDIYQRMISVSELLDSSRDVLTGAQDVYLNSVNERLTLVATIFFPLTVLTGFFGMNFGWMVRHIASLTDFLIYGVGGMAIVTLGVLALFWRAGYLGRGTEPG